MHVELMLGRFAILRFPSSQGDNRLRLQAEAMPLTTLLPGIAWCCRCRFEHTVEMSAALCFQNFHHMHTIQRNYHLQHIQYRQTCIQSCSGMLHASNQDLRNTEPASTRPHSLPSRAATSVQQEYNV